MLQGMFPKGKANEISSGIRYTIFLKTSRDQNSKLLGQVKIIGIQWYERVLSFLKLKILTEIWFLNESIKRIFNFE